MLRSTFSYYHTKLELNVCTVDWVIIISVFIRLQRQTVGSLSAHASEEEFFFLWSTLVAQFRRWVDLCLNKSQIFMEDRTEEAFVCLSHLPDAADRTSNGLKWLESCPILLAERTRTHREVQSCAEIWGLDGVWSFTELAITGRASAGAVSAA